MIADTAAMVKSMIPPFQVGKRWCVGHILHR
jgi:hypothetical protein